MYTFSLRDILVTYYSAQHIYDLSKTFFFVCLLFLIELLMNSNTYIIQHVIATSSRDRVGVFTRDYGRTTRL